MVKFQHWAHVKHLALDSPSFPELPFNPAISAYALYNPNADSYDYTIDMSLTPNVIRQACTTNDCNNDLICYVG